MYIYIYIYIYIPFDFHDIIHIRIHIFTFVSVINNFGIPSYNYELLGMFLIGKYIPIIIICL